MSRIGRLRLLAELPIIAYMYEQERRASAEPSISMKRLQFDKIRKAADELLRHLFAERSAQDRKVQSGHFWELPASIRAPLERATEIEARRLHQEWQNAGHEAPGYDPNFPPVPYPHDTDGLDLHYQSAARLNAALWAVRLIQRAATTVTEEAARKTKRGRGGNKHKGKPAQIILLESLFKLHNDVHRRAPRGVEAPGISESSDGKSIGGSTLRFVETCLAVLSPHAPELGTISKNTIRHRFRDWQSAKSIIEES